MDHAVSTEAVGAKPLPKASTRAGIQIDTREELINALQEAIQIEHGLMLQYLFAALSCKKRTSEGASEEDLELIRQWEAGILAIAREEMAHFATACNLITAVGGSPDFNRPNFPQAEHRWFPFSFQLERLNTECIGRFVRAESPKPTMFAEAIAPEPIEFDYVGELYGLIASGFDFLVKNLARGEADLFIGRPESQDADTWSANLSIFPITNLSSAKAAITYIVEQGEGTTTASDRSHFATFTTIARQLKEKINARPGFSPSRNVLKNPLTRAHRDAGPGYNLIDPVSIAHPVAELFNHVYASVLLLLMTFFDPAGESAEQRGVARDTARRVMSGLLRPLAEMLTVLPATPDPNGPTGGAPFELYGTLKIPPNPSVRLAILSERFSAAAGEARRLLRLGDPLLTRLEFLSVNFDLVAKTLSDQR